MTSIRRIIDAGQKKWKPTTLSGRVVASPISVIDSADVLEEMIAWPGVTSSISEKTACLISIRSGTASMTKSTSPKPSYSVVPGDAAEDLGGLGIGLLLGDLLLLDQPGELSLRDLLGLLQAGVDEFLLDVLQDDVDAGGGDDLGDLASHRPGADDGRLEYEHWSSTVSAKCDRRGYRRWISRPPAGPRRGSCRGRGARS